jgi:hypothetical protein
MTYGGIHWASAGVSRFLGRSQEVVLPTCRPPTRGLQYSTVQYSTVEFRLCASALPMLRLSHAHHVNHLGVTYRRRLVKVPTNARGASALWCHRSHRASNAYVVATRYGRMAKEPTPPTRSSCLSLLQYSVLSSNIWMKRKEVETFGLLPKNNDHCALLTLPAQLSIGTLRWCSQARTRCTPGLNLSKPADAGQPHFHCRPMAPSTTTQDARMQASRTSYPVILSSCLPVQRIRSLKSHRPSVRMMAPRIIQSRCARRSLWWKEVRSRVLALLTSFRLITKYIRRFLLLSRSRSNLTSKLISRTLANRPGPCPPKQTSSPSRPFTVLFIRKAQWSRPKLALLRMTQLFHTIRILWRVQTWLSTTTGRDKSRIQTRR